MAFLDDLELQELNDLLGQIPYSRPWRSSSFHPVSGNTCSMWCHFHFITGETQFKHSWPKTIWHVLPKPRSESGLSCFQNGAIILAYCIPAFIEGMSDSFAHPTNLHSFTTTYSPLGFPLPEEHRNHPSSQIASGAALRTGAHGQESGTSVELISPQAPSMGLTCTPHTTCFYHYIIWTDW